MGRRRREGALRGHEGCRRRLKRRRRLIACGVRAFPRYGSARHRDSRRKLANALGKADVGAGIPEARWVRAITFERLVRNESSRVEVATTTVGRLTSFLCCLGRRWSLLSTLGQNVETTAELLAEATAERCRRERQPLYALAVPFVGFEDLRRYRRKARLRRGRVEDPGEGPVHWLVVGDAKDYERLRSRIDDARLLKGFLQVALGAESAAAWSRLPVGMEVHRWGVLAVPRNAFLQPEALVEDVADHRGEVRMRSTSGGRKPSGPDTTRPPDRRRRRSPEGDVRPRHSADLRPLLLLS